MDLYQVIKTRRSIRSYRPDPIPEEKLNRVLEATRLAPSGNNRQPLIASWSLLSLEEIPSKIFSVDPPDS
ncbi:MAG: nitroreductase family protein [bacterium]